MAIQAIETLYNGIKFRSRLEAKWAYFFDLAGIVYRYEPTAFKLDDGTIYLPDFFLPDVGDRANNGLWVEVKGELTDADVNKVEQFSGFRELADGGFPDFNSLVLAGDIPNNSDELWNAPYPFWQAGCVDGDDGYQVQLYRNEDGSIGIYGGDNVHDIDGFHVFDECYARARKARFDHGQTPKAERII